MADEIIVKYVADTKAATKSLDDYIKTTQKVDSTTSKTTKDVEKSYSQMSTSVTTSLKNIAGAVGIAFGTQQLIAFGKEAVQLAAKAEGVERAFKRIGSPQLLADLRAATRGTVSDLQLMQRAVQASNFKLPLEQLAGLLKFASARARETGESVDYLVNSIVLGIGRKSPLILDNLGISAVELRERLKGVGVEATSVADIARIVGDIASEELAKMGEQADTTADKIAQLNTRVENLKVTIGEQLAVSLNDLADAWDLTAESELKAVDSAEDFFDEAKSGLIPIIGPLTKLGQIWQFTADNMRIAVDVLKEFGEEAKEAAYRLTLSNKELIEFNKNSKENKRLIVDAALGLIEFGDGVEEALDPMQMFYDNLSKQNKEVPEVIKNLAYYNQLIEDLKDEQSDANTTRARVRELEDEINEAIRQRLILLGKLREVGGASMQTIESIAVSELDVQQQLTDDIIKDYEYRNGEIEKAQDKLNAMLKAKAEEQAAQQEQLIIRSVQEGTNLVRSLGQLISMERDAELASLQRQLDAEMISREEYDKQRRELLNKQAEEEKSFAIFDSIINGAVAVVNAYKDGGPVLAAITAAAVAAEVAVIAAQPVPQFAKGVIDLDGKGTETSDSIPARLSRGESVMTAKETRIHKELFKSIRANKYDDFIMKNHVAPVLNTIMDGGLGALGASYSLNKAFNDKNLLRLGDRNRKAAHDDARFIVSELKKVMKPRKRGGYA